MPILTVNGARHYYRLKGRASSARRVVLVHSVGTDLSIWDGLVRDLLPTHQILRYDIRGHSGSDSTPGEYSLEMLADDLLGLTRLLDWRQFAVSGVSIGGMIASKCAVISPERIQRLLLCSAAPQMGVRTEDWNTRIELVSRSGIAGQTAAMVDRMFSREYKATNPPELDMLKVVFAGTNPLGYASCLAVLRDANLVPELGLVQAPVMLVTGARDTLIGQEAVQAFASGVKDFKHVELDCGHYPLIEARNEFSKLAKGFLCA